MAHIWPRKLPDYVIRDPRRSAERKVFDRLDADLDDSWSVFYSRPWLGLNQRGGEVDGEADFILAHPNRGILFIEVKGGGIRYDPLLDRWTSTDRYGTVQKIKDPVKQALTCKHNYIKRLKLWDSWPDGYVRFRHGVILPDTHLPNESVPSIAGYDTSLFCFGPAFTENLLGWIEDRLDEHGAHHPELGPGESGIDCLRALVTGPVTLSVAMQSIVEGEMHDMDALLTGAQLGVLVQLDSMSRAVVEGGAGTGKTVVACELAARAAAKGHSVLVLCVSEPLARHLAGRLDAWPKVQSLTLGEFRSRVSGPAVDRRPSSTWDLVVVDEGQDVPAALWPMIERAVGVDGKGPFVFLDSNQAVYLLGDDVGERLGAASLSLRLNLRNTRKIAAVTEDLYRGPLVVAEGPEGEAPRAIRCSSAEVIPMAVQEVLRLTVEESLPLSMIAVLSEEEVVPLITSALAQRGITVRTTSQVGEAVIVESVRRFKGLEAPVVIVVTSRRMAQDPELAYVAVSRARSRLNVVGPFEGTLLSAAVERAEIRVEAGPTG